MKLALALALRQGRGFRGHGPRLSSTKKAIIVGAIAGGAAGFLTGAAVENRVGAQPSVSYDSRLLDRRVASVRIASPHPASASACGHSVSSPTPFRKMPRTITRK